MRKSLLISRSDSRLLKRHEGEKNGIDVLSLFKSKSQNIPKFKEHPMCQLLRFLPLKLVRIVPSEFL